MDYKNKYNFLKELNPYQYEAATTTEGPLLILAGAGSGKTKTIVARTAFIIAEKKALPDNILVLTFTNKAATEMKNRGIQLLAKENIKTSTKPDFSTFHAWGVKFLRNLEDSLLKEHNLNAKFVIADEYDQQSIFKKIMPNYMSDKELKAYGFKGYKKLTFVLSRVLTYLPNVDCYECAIKDFMKYFEDDHKFLLQVLFSDINEELENDFVKMLAKLYVDYKEYLRDNNMVDFDDLISLPLKIIKNNKRIQEFLHYKYKYIMVDEFQDTNYAQLELLKAILNPEKRNICVVGDDAQSIYGWRGAKIELILNFHSIFENAKKINLKINYRSCKNIVDTANHLLDHASQKHEFKEKLEPFSNSPGIVKGVFFQTSEDEANSVVETIKHIRAKTNIPFEEIAVLYRSNFINTAIEKAFINAQIPYKIYKGRTILERKFIQELINLLKMLYNEDQELGWYRLLENFITTNLISKIESFAKENKKDLGSLILNQEFDGLKIRKDMKERLINLSNKYSLLKEYLNDYLNKKIDYQEFIDKFFDEKINPLINKYYEIQRSYYNGEKISEKKQKEAESALNLAQTLKDIMEKHDSLEKFLEILILEGEEADTEKGKVNLMTVHASKGLEFDVVFLIGFSQGIFPSNKSLDNVDTLEEERRIAYVALTRARKLLFVSGAQIYGAGSFLMPSMFFYESKIFKNNKEKY